MPKVTPPIINFNAGELSPLIDARFDIEKYQNGCQILEGGMPLVEGGVKKFPGTYYITSTKYSDRKARLVPFEFSVSQAYHIEMGDGYMRFFKDQGLIVLGPDDVDDFDPADSYKRGMYTKLGAYGTFTWSGSKQLNIAFPYGATSATVAVSANTSDVLSVTEVAGVLTIKLANSKTTNNTASLVQTAIRGLGGIYASCVAVANPAYSDSPPITSPSASTMETDDSLWKCTENVTAGPAGVFTWTTGNKVLTITEAGSALEVEANTEDVLTATFPTTYTPNDPITIKLANATSSYNDASYVQAMIRTNAVYKDAIASGNATYDASPPITSPDTSVVYVSNTSYFPTNSDYWETASEDDVVEIETDYALSDLFDIDCNTQSGDVIYFMHADYTPKKLVRHSHANWELRDMTILGTVDIAKTGQEGIAKGIFEIERSNPCQIRSRSHGLSVGDQIFIAGCTGMTEINEGVYVVCSIVSSNSFKIQLDSSGFSSYAEGQDGGTFVPVVPLFNQSGDYPACCALFGQRLYLGGSNNHPLRLNGSVVSDFERFISCPSLDDYAVQYDIAAGNRDRIRWLVGQKALLIGTPGGIFKATGASTNEPITHSSINITQEVFTGVANIHPVLAGDSVLWVTRSAKIVRMLQYIWEQDKWTYPDMTRLARHITIGEDEDNSGIVQAAFQREPYPIVWCLRNDGQLLGMTHESQEQVYAWFRVPTDGEIESFSIISQDNGEDEIMIIVKRTIDGSDVRYVEYFKEHEIFSQIEDAFFVHSGLTWDGGDAVTITGITNADPAVVTASSHGFSNGDHVCIEDVEGMTEVNCTNRKAYYVYGATDDTFQLYGTDSSAWGTYTSGGTVKAVKKAISTGLDHLEGKTVDVVVDGAVLPQKTVSSGAIDLDGFYGNKIHVGLHYDTIIKTMKLHAGSQTGTSRGKKQKINKATFLFHETVGCQYGIDEDNLFDVPFTYGDQPSLVTDDIDVDIEGDWDDEAELYILHDKPLPFTLKGIIPRVSVNDD